MYDERFVTPMRQELTQLGVEEMRTPQEVDAKLKGSKGTTLVVVNSVCGCAARNARPAVARAIQHAVKPDALTTVFAGQDVDAVQRARSYFVGYPPSSPQIGLLKDGKVVLTARITVAADGKTRTVTVNTTDANGKKVTSTAFYDKQ